MEVWRVVVTAGATEDDCDCGSMCCCRGRGRDVDADVGVGAAVTRGVKEDALSAAPPVALAGRAPRVKAEVAASRCTGGVRATANPPRGRLTPSPRSKGDSGCDSGCDGCDG